MQSNFTASPRAEHFLLTRSCSVWEMVQDDLECTSVMEIDNLKSMINASC